MSIKDFREKIKSSREQIETLGINARNREKLMVVLLICLVGTSSFGLGTLSAVHTEKVPLTIQYADSPAKMTASFESGAGSKVKGLVFGSRNGTKYYFPSCVAGTRILEENKIWFDSEKEAQDLGYSRASNCTQ